MIVALRLAREETSGTVPVLLVETDTILVVALTMSHWLVGALFVTYCTVPGWPVVALVEDCPVPDVVLVTLDVDCP